MSSGLNHTPLIVGASIIVFEYNIGPDILSKQSIIDLGTKCFHDERPH